MNARLIKGWQDLQSSYYFIPSLMGLGSVILAYATIYLDRHYGLVVSDESFLLSNKATGARTILATIAGAMIGVAATTFSITMVAVTSAAGQYGPRLIGNFMRDRGNQVTLGTFTSTFIYCLLILRVARSASYGQDISITEFVPNISLLVAMGLTLMSVGVLIYFIHHVPETLNVGNITGRVGRQLRCDIEDRYAVEIGEPIHPDSVNLANFPLDKSINIKARAEGYIQAINQNSLLKLATETQAIVKIEYRPGDFVTKGDVIMRLWLEDELKQGIDESVDQSFRNSFAMGQERTSYQNILFLADELVEILARALSPGVNDPFTAINCINWYHSALKSFLNSESPSPFRADKNGDLRVIAFPISFERFASVLCDQSRAYIAADRNTTLKMMTILTELSADCEDEARRSVLLHHLALLLSAARTQLASKPDSDAVEDYYKKVLELIEDPEAFQKAEFSQNWVAGRG